MFFSRDATSKISSAKCKKSFTGYIFNTGEVHFLDSFIIILIASLMAASSSFFEKNLWTYFNEAVVGYLSLDLRIEQKLYFLW